MKSLKIPPIKVLMKRSDELRSKLEREESNAELIVRISLEDKIVFGLIRTAYVNLLREHNYNVSALIRYLRIPRQTFYNKMGQYGIDLKEIRKLE